MGRPKKSVNDSESKKANKRPKSDPSKKIDQIVVGDIDDVPSAVLVPPNIDPQGCAKSSAPTEENQGKQKFVLRVHRHRHRHKQYIWIPSGQEGPGYEKVVVEVDNGRTRASRSRRR